MEHIKSSSELKKDLDDDTFMSTWKMFKARENFRLTLQMEGLKKNLDEQIRAATVLNLIELPPDNMDEEEIFNERLEYREGELAGNYGKASKKAIETFYGDSKPVFKYAEIAHGKPQRQVIQEIPEILVIPDKVEANECDALTQVIFLEEPPSEVDTINGANNLFQLPSIRHMAFPESDSLPDLTAMETQVELAEIDLTDFVTYL